MAVLLAPNARMTETKLVAGEVALDAANPTVLQTGLRAVASVTLTVKANATPGLNTSILTYEVVGGLVNVFAWKPTSATNPTLIASTGTETISYVIVGS